MSPEEKEREKQLRLRKMREARERWLKVKEETDPRLKEAIRTLRELSGRA
jgi:hypothetical protein